MTLKTRMRVLRTHQMGGAMHYSFGPDSPWAKTIYDRQVTVSEGHAWPKDRGIRDAGGDFDTFKLLFETSSSANSWYSTGGYTDALGTRSYSGNHFVDINFVPQWFTNPSQDPGWYGGFVPISGESQLIAQGTKFISQSIPTNSIADASVSLAELYREGLPLMIGAQLLKGRASFFRDLGSEYLNFEFGWRPFVNDIKKAAQAIISSDDVLKQLERDSGRDVHRRRYLPVQKTATVTNGSGTGGYGIDSQLFSSPSIVRRSTLTERGQWFSGSFTYHFDPGHMSTIERIVTEARLLYGLELTPEVLWNLAPWSWLADWVFDIGPVLHNLSMFQSDGLVMRYAYIMEYNSVKQSVYGIRGNMKVTTDLPKDNAVVYRGIRKTRRKATPYGFGLDFAGFSNRQWAILAALGITRAPRTL